MPHPIVNGTMAVVKARRPLKIEVQGQTILCHKIGAVADALGRTSATIRYWERTGLLPKAPILMPGRDPRRGRRRLYPVEYVKALSDLADREDWGPRLPDHSFWRVREQLLEVHRTVVQAIQEGSGAGSRG